MICDCSSAHRGDRGVQWEVSASGRRAQKFHSSPCRAHPVGNSHLKYTYSFSLDRDEIMMMMMPGCEVCSTAFSASPWHTSGFKLSLPPILKVSKCHRTDGRETIVVFPGLTPPAEHPSLQEWQSPRVTLGTRRPAADGTRQDPSLC